MEALEVRCNEEDQNCTWVGELGQLVFHSIVCPSRVVLCPKKCSTVDGKPTEYLLKDLDVHLEEDCPYRISECPHCNEEGTFDEITKSHLANCPMVLAQCPNEGCEAELCSSLLRFHVLTECEFALIECKHRELGCDVALLHSELDEHERDDSLHFRVMMSSMTKLQRQVETSRAEICLLKDTLQAVERDGKLFNSTEHTPVPSTIFKVPQFGSYKNKDNFTYDRLDTEEGYRFCARILPNNDDHLSVYFFLMKGPKDHNLPWPFKGKIKVELLNQVEDSHHFSKTVEFPKEHGQKVREGETSDKGYGISRFMELEQLLGKSKEKQDRDKKAKIKYLLDDSLYFRVSITPRVKRRWLKCTN